MRTIASTVLLLFSVAICAQEAEVDNDFSPGSSGAAAASRAYGGDGGDARAYGYGGDARAYGGNAYQHQGQQQGQHQGQNQGQGQYQGNFGINKAVGTGNETTVSISDSQKVEAEPAIAPDLGSRNPTAPCYATWDVSGAGGGVVAIGLGGYKYDVVCGSLEFYRQVAQDPGHKAQADQVVGLAHAVLLERIEDELGPEKYAALTSESKSGQQSASLNVRFPDGGMMKVSLADDRRREASEPSFKQLGEDGPRYYTTADR